MLINIFQYISMYLEIFLFLLMMKTVICRDSSILRVSDAFGRALPTTTAKRPEKGSSYRVTGEMIIDGILYYLLMGFGIKTAFRADKFQDV